MVNCGGTFNDRLEIIRVTLNLYAYSVMEEVEEIVHKHVKRRKRCVLLQRILYSQHDQDAIKDCKERLQNALDLFTVSLSFQRRNLPGY